MSEEKQTPIGTMIVVAIAAGLIGYVIGKPTPPQVQAEVPDASEKPTEPEEETGKEVAQPTTPKGINQTSKVKIGTPIWEFETGDSVVSYPAIGSDGTVYVGSVDNKLYAIKTDSKGLAKSPWPMRGQNAQHTGRTK